MYLYLFWHIFVVLQRNTTLDFAEVRQMCVKRDINTSKQHFKTEIYKSSKIYKRDVLKMRQINVERNMNTPKQHFKRELCSSTETYKKDVLTIQKRRIDDTKETYWRCRRISGAKVRQTSPKHEHIKSSLQNRPTIVDLDVFLRNRLLWIEREKQTYDAEIFQDRSWKISGPFSTRELICFVGICGGKKCPERHVNETFVWERT